MNFRRNTRREAPRVDITSLVDVVFLLIIFLLVSTTFKKKEHAFEIHLPKAGVDVVVAEQDVAYIYVARQGGFAFLDPRQGSEPVEMDTAEALVERVKAYLKEGAGLPIRIRGEENTPYQRIIQAVELARRGGADDVQLEYEKEDGARGVAPAP